MKHVRMTTEPGHHRLLAVNDYATIVPKHKDYGIVASMPRNDQNSLRHLLALLWKMDKATNDLLLADDATGNRWLLLSYQPSWPTRAHYLAGMVKGYRMRTPKKRRKGRIET